MITSTHRSGMRPRCEGLEARRLLTATDLIAPELTLTPPDEFWLGNWELDVPAFSFLGVLGGLPADGTVTDQPVDQLGVHFDRPIDPFTIGNDLVLTSVQPDGSEQAVELQGVSRVSPDDPALVVLPLDQPLGPGHYRLFLASWSFPSGLDGSFYFNETGTDRLLADFTVEAAGSALDSAVELQLFEGPTTSAAGSLDFAANPHDVALFRFTLPADQPLWNVGLELAATRLGGSLHAALAIFDEAGAPIATATLGRADFPDDPFLFAGLAPGTYYVGVSAAENRPGQPGGYDLASGDPGTTTSQAGGAFELNVRIVRAGPPAHVLGFALDYADPIDSTPTGFRIQFAGPIQLGPEGAAQGSHVEDTLEVVDRSGRGYAIAGVAYDESQSLLTYLFCEELPPGVYFVRTPDHGGLTDLAGRQPVGAGRNNGALVSFRVPPKSINANANDLGTLYPIHSEESQTIAIELQPGEQAQVRYVVASTNSIRYLFDWSGAGLDIELLGPSGSTAAVDPGQPGFPQTRLQYQRPGVYLLNLTATGDAPIRLALTISTQSASYESLLLNGVGQGPALNLQLVAPSFNLTAAAPGGATATNPTMPSGTGLAALFPIAVTTSLVTAPELLDTAGGARGPNTAPVSAPANLFLTVGGELVGLPAATGSNAPSESATALALQTSGQAVVGQGGTIAALAPSSVSPEAAPGTELTATDAATETAPDGAVLPALASTKTEQAVVLTTFPAEAPVESLEAFVTALAQDIVSYLGRPSGSPMPALDAPTAAEAAAPSLAHRFIQPAGEAPVEAARLSPVTFGSLLAAGLIALREPLARWFASHRPFDFRSRARRSHAPRRLA